MVAPAALADGKVHPALSESHWQSLPDLPQPRYGHGFVVFGDCLWVIGGNTTWGPSTTAAVDKYCPSVDPTRWVSGPPLPVALSNFAGVGVLGGRVFVAGGVTATEETVSDVYMLTPQGAWTRLAESMPLRTACGGGTVVNGRLYVYGSEVWPGSGRSCEFRSTENQLLELDPTRPPGQRWRNFGPVPSGWWQCGYRLHSRGAFVVIEGGGECGLGWPSAFDHYFDTQTSRWEPGYLGGTLWFQGVATVLGLTVRFGGRNGDLWYSPSRDVRAGDYAIGRGSPLPDLPRGMLAAEAVEFRGSLVIAGGEVEETGLISAHVDRLPLNRGCDIHEPDGSLAQASPIRARTTRDFNLEPIELGLGRTCSASDVDLIRIFDRPSSVGVRVELTAPAGVDLQLALFDSTATRLLARSANRGSAIESLTLPDEGSEFILRVQTQNGSFSLTQPYQLRLVPAQ